MNASDWDAYRAAYPTMTYADVAAFHRRVWDEYPDQDYHSPEHLARFFAGIDARYVLELGGWRGAAARSTLAAHPEICEWHNLEVCQPAVAASVTSDPRYRPCYPPAWPWEMRLARAYDTAVLAHLIEHVSDEQLSLLVAWLGGSGVRHAYVEAPLLEGPRSWRRQTSAHVLGLGWSAVIDLFSGVGLGVRERHPTPEGEALYFGASA